MELSQLQPRIELRRDERLVLIIQGILDDQGYEEPAVNVMNDGLIPDLPASIAVEVPAKVHRSGLKPISFSSYPKGFGALLRAYSGVYDLTVEAILTGKKEYVLQALLANPTVGTYRELRELVDLMIERQQPYLGYLQ
jgi:alpha-galactosidase